MCKNFFLYLSNPSFKKIKLNYLDDFVNEGNSDAMKKIAIYFDYEDNLEM